MFPSCFVIVWGFLCLQYTKPGPQNTEAKSQNRFPKRKNALPILQMDCSFLKKAAVRIEKTGRI